MLEQKEEENILAMNEHIALTLTLTLTITLEVILAMNEHIANGMKHIARLTAEAGEVSGEGE